jgi:hypothetical protein
LLRCAASGRESHQGGLHPPARLLVGLETSSAIAEVARFAMNTPAFLADQERHFTGSYRQFEAFGGPCIYFHLECLRAGREAFLSHRHIEMLYATLTAWGLHRMGDVDATKTKLKDWKSFHDSLLANASALRRFVSYDLLQMSEVAYSQALSELRSCYKSLDLSVSGSTVVVNSKALHHMLPELIPPIDRQYTVRFLTQLPEKWRGRNGKFRQIQLPKGPDAQFRLFHETCMKIKRLADRVDPALFKEQRLQYAVTVPKALDNAIVSFVRTVSPAPAKRQ